MILLPFDQQLTEIRKVDGRFSLYRCSCGIEKVISHYDVDRGATRSCGCMKLASEKVRFRKHGMSQTSVYQVWFAMIKRCENPSCKDYPNYGGRGIKVCKRWHSFENFIKDMGPRPEASTPVRRFLTLERKNNDGNYCPSNCKWATYLEQASNTRRWAA